MEEVAATAGAQKALEEYARFNTTKQNQTALRTYGDAVAATVIPLLFPRGKIPRLIYTSLKASMAKWVRLRVERNVLQAELKSHPAIAPLISVLAERNREQMKVLEQIDLRNALSPAEMHQFVSLAPRIMIELERARHVDRPSLLLLPNPYSLMTFEQAFNKAKGEVRESLRAKKVKLSRKGMRVLIDRRALIRLKMWGIEPPPQSEK